MHGYVRVGGKGNREKRERQTHTNPIHTDSIHSIQTRTAVADTDGNDSHINELRRLVVVVTTQEKEKERRKNENCRR